MSWFRHQYAIGSQDNYNYYGSNVNQLITIAAQIEPVKVNNVDPLVIVSDKVLLAPPPVRPERLPKKKRYGFYR